MPLPEQTIWRCARVGRDSEPYPCNPRNPRSMRQNFLQRINAPLILLRCADGNADPFRQMIPLHRPDDDAELLHFLEHMIAFIDADEDEVRGGRNEFEFQVA